MLRERFSVEMKAALRAQDKIKLATMRLINAVLKDRDIAARETGNTTGIPESDIIKMLEGMIKQRKESVAMYEQAGRAETAAQEREEMDVIRSFLPAQLSPQQIDAAITKAIEATDATSVKDMGKAMAWLRDHHAGQMDFAAASGALKKRLGSLSGS